MKAKTVLPAVAMTAVSMVLTLAVVLMWLGGAVPWPVALVVGLGIDGGWLATLAYERRLAAQGDHSRVVTAVGWCFGLVATGVLIAHALTAEGSAAAWLAVAWLPVAAKALWVVHGLWERTALTTAALDDIRGIQQEARDAAAVARARLRAEASTEETRLTAVTQAGARVARVQAKTAKTLSAAWSTLEDARDGEETGRALTSVTTPVTPGVTPRWELPIWGPVEPVTDLALETAPGLSDEILDALVDRIRHSENPALSYREMATRFRAAGHSASEVRLRAAWKRVA
ncbi:protein spdB [Streptomyces sp. NPDC047108]|uniref:protein spdB n=1 Tax=Streptomyces sp. NPDC047108 TaxID=3155025 RepID=UPI0033C2AFFC